MTRAFLLAAGLGTRLRPLTDLLPKVMVPISGRPLLDYWLESLFSAGVEKVLINTHYKADFIRRHIESSIWRDEVEVVYEEELLLTGGSILANEKFLNTGEPFFVAHADNLVKFDLSLFKEKHERFKGDGLQIDMTLMTFPSDRPKSCGIVELDDAGLVRAFHEKVLNPPGNLANGAVYIFEPTLFELLKKFNRAKIDLSTEVIPQLLGSIGTYHNSIYLRDVGTLFDWQAAQKVIDLFQFQTSPSLFWSDWLTKHHVFIENFLQNS